MDWGAVIFVGLCVAVFVLVWAGSRTIHMIQLGKGFSRIQQYAYENVYADPSEMTERCRSGEGLKHAVRTILGMTVVYSIVRDEEGNYCHQLSVKSHWYGPKFLANYTTLLLGIMASWIERAGIEREGLIELSQADTGTFYMTMVVSPEEHQALRQAATQYWKNASAETTAV